MPELEYHRPKSLQQALELLSRARPLGGGTALTPRRAELDSVMDLQDLGLAGQELRAGWSVEKSVYQTWLIALSGFNRR